MHIKLISIRFIAFNAITKLQRYAITLFRKQSDGYCLHIVWIIKIATKIFETWYLKSKPRCRTKIYMHCLLYIFIDTSLCSLGRILPLDRSTIE